MSSLSGYAAWCLAGLMLCATLFFLRRPAVQVFRLALRSSIGLAALALFSQIGHLIGVTLGVNPMNALVLGILGVPGFGLLLMMQWILK